MKVPIHVSEEAYARIGMRQRQHIFELSNKLERGEPLTKDEIEWAVWAMRKGADAIPDKMPRHAGNPGKLPAGDVALCFAAMVNRQGKSKSKAREELAELYDVSVEAIRQCLKKHQDDAMKLIPPKQIK